jgi:hypothetical protein
VAVIDVQADATHLAFVQLTTHKVCSVGIQRRSGRHQRELEFGLAGVADGDPSVPVVHGDVGAEREAEHVNVEVPRLILVETVNGDE